MLRKCFQMGELVSYEDVGPAEIGQILGRRADGVWIVQLNGRVDDIPDEFLSKFDLNI